MTEITHRTVRTNGIDMHIAVAGEGRPVIMVHGFPGLWYSWRHQLPALAAAGYQAIAVDQRGYGRSSRPTDPKVYDADYVMNDMLGLLDALGEKKAIWVGHDFGAQLTYNLAVRKPERVAGVVGMACPYDFDLAGRGGAGSGTKEKGTDFNAEFADPTMRPSEVFAKAAKQHFLHLHYFQTIGPAEKELGRDPRLFLTRLFWALSERGNLLDWTKFPSEGTGYLDVLADPETPLPWPWFRKEDMDVYVAEYTREGADKTFIGGLNSYRVADRNWELGAKWADADVTPPSAFIAGASDPVLKMIRPDALDILRARSRDLRDCVVIPGAGHFVQQEQPNAVNDALLRFLGTLGAKDWQV
ncbi:MAG TPA: alpha/beta hydrolase [Alphaproteobacteria bacterium]|nr:alpha/beta hydrolase [Alphaproteobacteria bacterium]